MNRRVGILGGTFDPIHVGHLDAAAAAHGALGLERIVFVPSLQPPHRAEQPHASAFHRFAMTAMAAGMRPHYEASDLELRSGAGPWYTIDTLRRLHGAGFAPFELFFVTGADAFAEIATWKGYPELFEHAHFVVVSRPGQTAAGMRDRLPAWSAHMRDAAQRDAAVSLPSILLVEADTSEVSSTRIRQARRAGESIRGLVAPLVEAHIERHGLYAASPATNILTGVHG